MLLDLRGSYNKRYAVMKIGDSIDAPRFEGQLQQGWLTDGHEFSIDVPRFEGQLQRVGTDIDDGAGIDAPQFEEQLQLFVLQQIELAVSMLLDLRGSYNGAAKSREDRLVSMLLDLRGSYNGRDIYQDAL